MFWTDHALKKANCETREQFQRKYGLRCSGAWDVETIRHLWSWMKGYVNHRICEGETLYQVAQQYGGQVRDIVQANRLPGDRALLPGQLIQVPLPCAVVSEELGFGSDVQELWIDGLRARCPWLGVEEIGRTAGGRPLQMLRLGRGKRRVLMVGSQHGNEYITGILLWQMLEAYCSAICCRGSLFGFSAEELFHRTTLYALPLANPDGVEVVTGEIVPDTEEYKRARVIAAAMPDLPFPQGWKANLQGVDLNLNYPAGFEEAKDRKAGFGVLGPSPRDYSGETPLDQPETAAVAEFICRTEPYVLATWHTQGGEIYGEDARGGYPDADLAKRLACASGYTLTQVPAGSRGGGLRDWFVDKYDRPGFTIEAGRGENPLPVTDLPRLMEENLPMFALLLHG